MCVCVCVFCALCVCVTERESVRVGVCVCRESVCMLWLREGVSTEAFEVPDHCTSFHLYHDL